MSSYTSWIALLFLYCYCGRSGLHAARTAPADGKPKITRDDLLIVIPANTERLHLVRNTRVYRKGIRTLILTERIPKHEIRRMFPDPHNEYKETWGTYREVLGEQKALPGDLRAAIAPFLAAHMFHGTYKWILYGDDDTLWVVDNLLHYLSSLDEEVPYMISDALWFLNQGPPNSEQHHSSEAPRCLPCNYTDPLIDSGQCVGYIGEWKWHAPVACPCTPEVLCKSDNLNAFWSDTCGNDPAIEPPERINAMRVRPDKPWAPRPGFWYMQHGGAGTLLSHGLMQRATFAEVEEELAKMWKHSGDAMMFEIVWNLFGIGPTAPGYAFCRGYTMFDPGFQQTDLGGGGGDPLGVIERLESILMGTPLCDASCTDQMSNTLTVHIRARFTNFSAEWLEQNPTVPTAVLLKEFLERAEADNLQDVELGARLSKFFMDRLTLLFKLWKHPDLVDKLIPPTVGDTVSGGGRNGGNKGGKQGGLQSSGSNDNDMIKGDSGDVGGLHNGVHGGGRVLSRHERLMMLLRSADALQEQALDVDDSTSYTDWLTTPAGSLWLVMHGVGVFFLVLIMELVTGWGFLKLAGMIQGWRRTGRQGGGGARTRTPHAQRLVGHGD